MTIQPLTYAHLNSLIRMAESVGLPRVVDLGMGKSRTQGFYNTCAAHTILNSVETCRQAYKDHQNDWPEIPAMEVYKLARTLDIYKDWEPGTDIFSAGKAYCMLAGTGVRPMEVPINLIESGVMTIEEFISLWLAFQGTGVAIGLHWLLSDQFPGPSLVMEPNGDYRGKHAISIHGFSQSFSWYRYAFFKWKFGKLRTAPVFHIENTNNTHPELEFHLPMARLKKDLISAVVLVPPSFQ